MFRWIFPVSTLLTVASGSAGGSFDNYNRAAFVSVLPLARRHLLPSPTTRLRESTETGSVDEGRDVLTDTKYYKRSKFSKVGRKRNGTKKSPEERERELYSTDERLEFRRKLRAEIEAEEELERQSAPCATLPSLLERVATAAKAQIKDGSEGALLMNPPETQGEEHQRRGDREGLSSPRPSFFDLENAPAYGFVHVADVLGSHSLAGKVKVKSYSDFPKERFETEHVAFLLPRRTKWPIPVLVREGGAGPRNSFLLKVEGVTTKEEAAMLQGCALLAGTQEKPSSLKKDDVLIRDFFNATVVLAEDPSIEIGRVVGYLDGDEMCSVESAKEISHDSLEIALHPFFDAALLDPMPSDADERNAAVMQAAAEEEGGGEKEEQKEGEEESSKDAEDIRQREETKALLASLEIPDKAGEDRSMRATSEVDLWECEGCGALFKDTESASSHEAQCKFEDEKRRKIKSVLEAGEFEQERKQIKKRERRRQWKLRRREKKMLKMEKETGEADGSFESRLRLLSSQAAAEEGDGYSGVSTVDDTGVEREVRTVEEGGGEGDEGQENGQENADIDAFVASLQKRGRFSEEEEENGEGEEEEEELSEKGDEAEKSFSEEEEEGDELDEDEDEEEEEENVEGMEFLMDEDEEDDEMDFDWKEAGLLGEEEGNEMEFSDNPLRLSEESFAPFAGTGLDDLDSFSAEETLDDEEGGARLSVFEAFLNAGGKGTAQLLTEAEREAALGGLEEEEEEEGEGATSLDDEDRKQKEEEIQIEEDADVATLLRKGAQWGDVMDDRDLQKLEQSLSVLVDGVEPMWQKKRRWKRLLRKKAAQLMSNEDTDETETEREESFEGKEEEEREEETKIEEETGEQGVTEGEDSETGEGSRTLAVSLGLTEEDRGRFTDGSYAFEPWALRFVVPFDTPNIIDDFHNDTHLLKLKRFNVNPINFAQPPDKKHLERLVKRARPDSFASEKEGLGEASALEEIRGERDEGEEFAEENGEARLERDVGLEVGATQDAGELSLRDPDFV